MLSQKRGHKHIILGTIVSPNRMLLTWTRVFGLGVMGLKVKCPGLTVSGQGSEFRVLLHKCIVYMGPQRKTLNPWDPHDTTTLALGTLKGTDSYFFGSPHMVFKMSKHNP